MPSIQTISAGRPLPSKPRRVLVFTGHFHPHVGGVERFSRELWRRLAARGWDVTLATSQTHPGAAEEMIDGIRVLRLPVLRIVGERLPILRPSRALFRAAAELRAWSPRVIVTNTRFFSSSVLGVMLARRWGVPSMHIEHGSDHVRLGPAAADRISALVDHTVGRWVVRRATRCVGVSTAAARFVEHLGRAGAGVLYNGIDASAFDGVVSESRRELGMTDDNYFVLFVGRLIEDKGVLTAIDAIDRLGGGRAHLVVAGDGPLMPEVRRRAAGCDNIHLLGFVPPAEVARLLRACDVFVHPSDYPEGLPTSVLEAGAAGAAVIATPKGGTDEIIPTPEHGILVPPRDPGALADALRRLRDDPDLRRSLGCTLRAHVRRTFDWERIADSAESELNALVESEGNR